MKKLLLSACLLAVFFSCTKTDTSRPTSSFGQGVSGMNFTYNKGYTFFFDRPGGIKDSDFVIFHSNGSVTEVSSFFDSGSYTYPDSVTYVVNTSYDQNIVWQNISGVNLFTFYPIYDSLRHDTLGHHINYFLHDYLISDVVSVYKAGGYALLQVTPTLGDSTSGVTGSVILQ